MNRVALLAVAMECGFGHPEHTQTAPKREQPKVVAVKRSTPWFQRLLPFKTLAALLFRLN